ncbi:sorting nexin-29-like isoform X2 [Xenia sp. Carnegie-2017]|uniref:sorting nexin-29-like isoform X2 n=1 Tax=Xenia sp. Carnegie-2017 TaxID=2897299 RepID=UPI001F04C208|nr:sorting nexin-29-like isoform X2 [Xenia sp. Carnegie-2017]
MLNLASVDITKQAIIDRLLDGVKQCQVRFGSTTELASEKDSRISCLCEQWNIVLQFGIKSTKKINSLSQYYEQDALLLDDERSSMLPMMAAGLSSILFAIDIDKAEFNSITVQIPGNISQAVSRPTSIWAVPSPMYATSGAPGEVC